MNMKSLQKSILLFFTENFNRNIAKIPMFCWNEIKQQNQICGTSKKKYVVPSIKYLHLLLLPKLCLGMKILSPKLSSLGNPQVTINMIQN